MDDFVRTVVLLVASKRERRVQDALASAGLLRDQHRAGTLEQGPEPPTGVAVLPQRVAEAAILWLDVRNIGGSLAK